MQQGSQPFVSPGTVQPTPNKNKTWLTCLVIALILMCIGSLVVFLGLGGLIAVFGPDPEGLQFEVQSPGEVAKGETFEFSVILRNIGEKAFTVTEIQLPSSIIQAASPLSVNPPQNSQVDYDDSVRYQYEIILQPGESSQVSFQMISVEPGNYTGDVTVVVGNRRKSSNVYLIVNDVQASLPTQAVEPSLAPQASLIANSKVPFEAVVEIQALVNYDGELIQAWWGSGTIISSDGLILTNAHVISSTKNFDVVDLVVAMTIQPDQPPEPRYYAKVMQVDQNLDIAVIRIETDLNRTPVDRASLFLPYVPMGDSDALKLNDELIILGYPGIGGQTITLTDGRVGGFTYEEGYGSRAFVKTSATIAGGNSGGLAANSNGEIIGIPTQMGYGGDDQYADCRRLVDTNEDGVVDEYDTCIPTGGFINALRPIKLAIPFIEAARNGEENIMVSVDSSEHYNPEGEIYYQEDFSDPSNGWYTGTDEMSSYSYANGEYLIQVNNENRINWVTIGEELENSSITVEAGPQQSTGDGGFGLICRYIDSDNFYGLEVSEDGYYSIWRRDKGEYVFLSYWQYSDLIPQFQKMKITASCIDDRLSLAVNDTLLVEVTDGTFQYGDTGVFVETYEFGDLIIAFDNFMIKLP